MSVTVQNLDKLERKMTLTLPLDVVRKEVDARLKKLARTVRMDGFRPGKVPMQVVAQRYGYSVQYEVMNDKVGEAFLQAANEAQLRVAGQPSITETTSGTEGVLAFDAVFEVLPEVSIGDLAGAELERISTEVTEEAVDKTLDILRKQRRTYALRAHDTGAQDGDRVTLDFDGKIDGESFQGGKAEQFTFIIGDGQMLKEFEAATLGMKVAESKTFQLPFPEDYHGKEVAGKTADFMVTVRKIESAHLPEINEAFARALGIAAGTVEALRADIRKNLEREVKFRVLGRNKQAVFDALLSKAELDLPKASVQAEIHRLQEGARNELRQRGMKDVEKATLPDELFQAQAERRVRLGLAMAELVRANHLQARSEQIRAHIDEMAASYEKPADVVRWYYGDNQRLAEVEAVVTESNITEFVLSKAKVVDKQLPFDELMAQQV